MGFRRPSRQIEVFDISLMAVVTKAMGAFLVLTVLLMPYYISSPDVAATSAQAHDELEQARKQMEDLARQLGANPDDADALRRALQKMRDTLNAAEQKIDDLSKQANALNSQLQRARADAQSAQDEASREKAALRQTQAWEADMEVQANRAAQALRVEQATAAELEQQANQAAQALRAKQVASAELEQQSNQAAQGQRVSQVAQAEGEQISNTLANVVKNATLTPKYLLFVTWVPDAACATAPVQVNTLRRAPPKLPPNIDPKRIGAPADGLIERSNRIEGHVVLGKAEADHPVPSMYFVGFWDNQWRDLTFAYANTSLPAPCHFSVTTSFVDLVGGTSFRQSQSDVTLPVTGEPTLLGAVTDVGATHFLQPDQDDLAFWAQRKADIKPRDATPAPDPAVH
jgi:hypothetical protein